MTQLKTTLKNNELSVGCWITLGHPAIAEILSNAGFDWLTVDLEHSTISIAEAGELIRIIELNNCSALVRLTENDAGQIKRVLDAGATGIIVPMVKTKQEAEAAVSAMYYPPAGTRGVGLARAQGYGPDFVKYKENMHKCQVCIVQIEHIQAVENIEAILNTEGVDGYILGPYDLSASMGVAGQLDHPDVIDAMEKVYTTAEKLRIPGGLHIVEPDMDAFEKLVNKGLKFIAYSLDIRMLDVSARTCINKIRTVK